MKQITDFKMAIEYVNRLGFAGTGSIVQRQHNLAAVTDGLLHASGASTWDRRSFQPFEVRYIRRPKHVRASMGLFIVKDPRGKKWVYNPLNGSYDILAPSKTCGGRGILRDPDHACAWCKDYWPNR